MKDLKFTDSQSCKLNTQQDKLKKKKTPRYILIKLFKTEDLKNPESSQKKNDILHTENNDSNDDFLNRNQGQKTAQHHL